MRSAAPSPMGGLRDDRGTDLEGWKRLLAIGATLVLTSVLVGAVLSLTERIAGRCELPATDEFASCFSGPRVYRRLLGVLIPQDIIQEWLALLAISAVFGVSLILAAVMSRGAEKK